VTTAIAPKTQLGKYQLVRHLASGGMAELWLARSNALAGFDRHVALKRIRHEHANDQRFAQMFLDEARLAGSLHHPNVATVHDIGQDGGQYYFTMEYVHGEDLRKILMHVSAREQHLPIEHVMTIMLAATSALHYAHEHKSQIVHRDVSPANVMVGYDGTVKVLDFGIAKAMHRTKDTQSGVLKGKVAYMSPEQCVGQPVDRRSDIFCLGIVMYEILTVRRLFKGANDFLTMSSIIHGDIPLPSTIRPGIPRELELIIMRALSPELGDRFQTADELRASLERFCIANHIRATPASLAEYMRSLFGKKPEPWHSDEEPEIELTYDFDGTEPGVVQVPEAALKRAALPSTTPIQPSAPIMKARTKAITGDPLASQPIAIAPAEHWMPTPAQSIAASAAALEADLHVGDVTQIVRAPKNPRLGKQIAIIIVVSAALIGIAFLVITKVRSNEAASEEARPEIRMPPPTTPQEPPPAPIVVPTDAEDPVAVTPDAAEPIVPTTAPPKVKPEKKRKKKKRRPVKRPPDAGSASWDPGTLFPEK
jgi:serine/threonine-protein kinase